MSILIHFFISSPVPVNFWYATHFFIVQVYNVHIIFGTHNFHSGIESILK